MDYPFVAHEIPARVPHWQRHDLFVTTPPALNSTATGRDTTRPNRENVK
jgi:hypothetical protein